MTSLFDPIRIGTFTAGNRVVMAPLTRNRAGAGQVPGDIAVTYYAQRATTGLIITEGTQPSGQGQGKLDTPGLFSDAQRDGWARVAAAVHRRGGRIVAQLEHAGRVGHPDNKPDRDVVAPSALAAPKTVVTPSGHQPFPVPRALATEEIPGVVEQYVHAARQAVAAGMDGVEIHCANGYLLHQFLAASTNRRTDGYGGSPQNRARLPIEIITAVMQSIGADRVGIRISPAHNIAGVIEDDPADTAATYRALVEAVSSGNAAYLSYLADPRAELTRDLRARFVGPVIGNSGLGTLTTRDEAQAILDEGLADLVAVGRLVIANPDLVHRWRTDAPLNDPDPSTFYGGGARGYTDYPALVG